MTGTSSIRNEDFVSSSVMEAFHVPLKPHFPMYVSIYKRVLGQFPKSFIKEIAGTMELGTGLGAHESAVYESKSAPNICHYNDSDSTPVFHTDTPLYEYSVPTLCLRQVPRNI